MSRAALLDLLERVLWTFVQGAAAELVVTQSLDLQTLKVAAVAGVVSAAKCLIATRFGDPSSAALPDQG